MHTRVCLTRRRNPHHYLCALRRKAHFTWCNYSSVCFGWHSDCRKLSKSPFLVMQLWISFLLCWKKRTKENGCKWKREWVSESDVVRIAYELIREQQSQLMYGLKWQRQCFAHFCTVWFDWFQQVVNSFFLFFARAKYKKRRKKRVSNYHKST